MTPPSIHYLKTFTLSLRKKRGLEVGSVSIRTRLFAFLNYCEFDVVLEILYYYIFCAKYNRCEIEFRSTIY